MKEYIERDAMIAKLEEVYCAKCEDGHCDYRRVPPEPCVIEDVVNWIDIQPAADVVERKSSDTGETESKPHKWLQGEAALAKAILDTIPGAYALCRHTDGHPYLVSAWDYVDTILVLIHGEESQTLFSPHYFPSLRPNEQVALEYIINNTEEVEHEGVH